MRISDNVLLFLAGFGLVFLIVFFTLGLITIGNMLNINSFLVEPINTKEEIKSCSTPYYDFDYNHTNEGFTLNINGSCIHILKSVGVSMKPYYDNNTLSILDTCFPKDKLKIGDVIFFWWDDFFHRTHHRIIDIDYEKKWVRTQGDNNETNKIKDDFTSFEKIYAKEIGVLNILDYDKEIKGLISLE